MIKAGDKYGSISSGNLDALHYVTEQFANPNKKIEKTYKSVPIKLKSMPQEKK